MAALFRRRVSLIVAQPLADDYKNLSAQVVEIDGLRVQFKVEKSLRGKDPNSAEITVWNLSPTSRALLETRAAKVVLRAGYEDSVEQLFVGDVVFGESKHEGPDWQTKILAGDGARARKFARVSRSFRAGAPFASVAKGIALALGVGVGNLPDVLATVSTQYVQGYAAHGPAARELDRVLKSAGYEWSIQDGQLQVLKAGTELRTTVVLDAEHGLVGSPEVGAGEEKGGPVLTATSLLQGSLVPGVRLDLRGETVRGLFRVTKVSHDGDTHGAEWYTKVEGKPL